MSKEHIYTIPINEALDHMLATEENERGCPFCHLFEKTEIEQADLIQGASMMESDFRLQTNRLGFCERHYAFMFGRKSKLTLALMLESHLAEVKSNLTGGAIPLFERSKHAQAYIGTLQESCYLCGKVDGIVGRMIAHTLLLWERDIGYDRVFKNKLAGQRYFCLTHYRALILSGRENLPKKMFPDFYKEISGVQKAYLEALTSDVSFFCSKFNYLNRDEPWGTSADAPERALKFLK